MRAFFYVCALLALLATSVVGFRGMVVAALCDTGKCVSDGALAAYEVMFWGGGAGFVAVIAWLVLRWAVRLDRDRAPND